MELQQLDELCQRVAELDQKLDDIGQADQRVRRLRTIPGVGPRLSELVVAMIDDPHRFANARQISAYAGLVPRCWAMLRDGSEWRVPTPHVTRMNNTVSLPAIASG